MFREARNERKAEKQERDIAVGRSALFKTTRIQSNFLNLHLHLEEAFKSQNAREELEPWQFVLPLATIPEPVHYSADELSLISSCDDYLLSDHIMSLDVCHNTFLPVFEMYRKLRKELLDEMEPDRMEGTIGEQTFTEAEVARLRTRMVELNSLVCQTKAMAKQYFDESGEAVELLIKRLNQKFGLNIRSEFKKELLDKLPKVDNASS